jgi:hypothetical protein
MNEMPYDSTNTDVPPDCININVDECIEIDGHKLTAEYIWSLQGQDRIDLVHKVFSYYRNKGFPLPRMTDEELIRGLEALKRSKIEIIDGTIKNSATSGLDVAKHFTGKYYLAAKGGPKTRSCQEVFEDDDLLMKVLKNRMGWLLSNEDMPNQPYLFNITDKMILQGMRSSGLAYAASNFKPAVAKALYERYNVKKTYDNSSGWGARAIAAVSLGIEYYATDPLTADSVNEILARFGSPGFCYSGGSEEKESYPEMTVDFVFSSPPYFNLESYDAGSEQSIVKFSNYDLWLEKFWRKTVENCLDILVLDGRFAFAMVDTVDKKPIAADMLRICQEEGLFLASKIDMVTSAGHLSKKAKTGKIQKNNDRIYVMER